MLLIGLTGGIATGKSTVSRMLRELGAPVIDADALVREVQSPGSPVLAEIAAAFGSSIIRPDGGLDRAALGRLIFADPELRRRLEAIVHPAVRVRMEEETARLQSRGYEAVVLDVPLLYEGGFERTVDVVWLVYVDRATQRVRLIERDGLSPEEAAQRIAAQGDLEAKRARADLIIDNRGAVEQTQSQVGHAWRQAINLLSQRSSGKGE